MLRVETNKWWRMISQLRSADWVLFLAVFALLALGLAAIYSVELSQGLDTFGELRKQFIAIGLGLVAFIIIALSNYKSFRNYTLLVYGFCNLLLVAVLFLGEDVRGSQGWFSLGGFNFQPVELMKIGLVLSLATYFAKKARRAFGLRTFFESLAITLVPVVLVLMQPDFGSASVLMGRWLLYVLFAGIPWWYVFAMGGVGVGMFILSWNYFFAEYQKARIMTFLDPSLDPLGQGYNVTQAIIAIGSGGWFGSGLGFGTQSQLKFLPESQTDFIFSVIAEELGFFGVTMLLLAFFVCFFRLWQKIRMARDDFTAYLVVGVGAVFFLQFFVNVGMNLGVFPVTGIGLPFVSYGGSSLIVMLILLAIVQSVSIRQRVGHG
jgi:rod shape determining protein RodA